MDLQPQEQRGDYTSKELTAYLSTGLKARIDNCKWQSPELPFFYKSASPSYVSQNVWRVMQRTGKKVGIEDCRPHRLRDTFAVRRLEAGIQIGDLSKMLGHSSVTMTERYYAKWTKGREDRLEGLAARSSTSTQELALSNE